MMETSRVTLAHGNGGRRMRELIEGVFARHLAGALDVQVDAAIVNLEHGAWAISVDGFTVDPIEFPGGDLGSLAVHGTVNDLAVAGAEPRYLTLSAILEEGLDFAVLERLVLSLSNAAGSCGVQVVAGDTKVVPRGSGGGAFFTTTGVGLRVAPHLALSTIRPGDHVLVSGPVGDHGVAVMLAREDFDLHGDLRSDCGSVLGLCREAWALEGVRFLRDPTRGGLATVASEVARATGHTVRLREQAVPVRDPVRSVCEMLGYDPYYLACEGRVVAVAAPDAAAALLDRWRASAEGRDAAVVGQVQAGPSRVVLETTLGGERILQELEDDPLPRIC